MSTKTQTIDASQWQIPKKVKPHKIASPPTKTEITGASNHWSLISLNINGLNSPIKRHRLTDQIQKRNPSFCCIQETLLNLKDRHSLRVKDGEKFFWSNEPKKQTVVAILISNKIDFKIKISQKRQRRTFHICHRKNPSRRNLNT